MEQEHPLLLEVEEGHPLLLEVEEGHPLLLEEQEGEQQLRVLDHWLVVEWVLEGGQRGLQGKTEDWVSMLHCDDSWTPLAVSSCMY